jgi:hypothetical protein
LNALLNSPPGAMPNSLVKCADILNNNKCIIP